MSHLETIKTYRFNTQCSFCTFLYAESAPRLKKTPFLTITSLSELSGLALSLRTFPVIVLTLIFWSLLTGFSSGTLSVSLAEVSLRLVEMDSLSSVTVSSSAAIFYKQKEFLHLERKLIHTMRKKWFQREQCGQMWLGSVQNLWLGGWMNRRGWTNFLWSHKEIYKNLIMYILAVFLTIYF